MDFTICDATLFYNICGGASIAWHSQKVAILLISRISFMITINFKENESQTYDTIYICEQV